MYKTAAIKYNSLDFMVITMLICSLLKLKVFVYIQKSSLVMFEPK